MSDAITSTKLEPTGEIFLDSRGCLSVLSPAHESEVGGIPCLCADCKILISPMLFKFSHSILDGTALLWNILGIFQSIFSGFCGPCHL